MDFLCRTYAKGPHFLHVHDEPSYHVDAMRNRDLGWRMTWDHCTVPNIPFSKGDPGVKPFQILNVTQYDPSLVGGGDYQRSTPTNRDDHHTRLIPLGDGPYDLNAVRDQINAHLAMGAEFLGFGDYVDSFLRSPTGRPDTRPELQNIYQDERGDM